MDADLVKEAPASRVLALPFTRIARELGRAMAANIVALGALAQLTGAVSLESLDGRGAGPGAQRHRGFEPPGPGRRGRRG